MPQQFTIDPDPPERGKLLKLCYSGARPATASISWDPPGEPTSVSFGDDADELCVTFTVPDDASSVIVHDDSGSSDDLARVVV